MTYPIPFEKRICELFSKQWTFICCFTQPRGEVECKLIIRRWSVKIGAGWKNFCALHELSA